MLLTPALVDIRHQYFRVFDVYVPIALGVFGIILILVVVLTVKNARRDPARASRRSEAERLEGGYALLLVCIVAGLLYLTYSAEHQTDTVANEQKPALTIAVTGAKWEWTFYYPAYRITVDSGTTGLGTFVVPAGEPVRFSLTSADVIHAFWLPQIRYKHDVNPGITQYATVEFPQVGDFPGQCAEFCGLRHADMVYDFRVLSPAQFAAWAQSHRGARL